MGDMIRIRNLDGEEITITDWLRSIRLRNVQDKWWHRYTKREVDE